MNMNNQIIDMTCLLAKRNSYVCNLIAFPPKKSAILLTIVIHYTRNIRRRFRNSFIYIYFHSETMNRNKRMILKIHVQK
jgi:hypothetical protein